MGSHHEGHKANHLPHHSHALNTASGSRSLRNFRTLRQQAGIFCPSITTKQPPPHTTCTRLVFRAIAYGKLNKYPQKILIHPLWPFNFPFSFPMDSPIIGARNCRARSWWSEAINSSTHALVTRSPSPEIPKPKGVTEIIMIIVKKSNINSNSNNNAQ